MASAADRPQASLQPAPGWRSDSGGLRPAGAPGPDRKPALWRGGRPLKQWRYVGVFGPSLMLCAGKVRIGPGRQSFWAVWDGTRLRERTRLIGHHAAVMLEPGRLTIRDDDVEVELALAEQPGVETICQDGRQQVWTRKQAGIAARGVARIGGAEFAIDSLGVVDDTVGYHARLTRWRWSAGVGTTPEGVDVAWNLVAGVNDPAVGSERTIWVAGQPHEVGPVRFAADLRKVTFAEGEELRCRTVATRSRTDNLLVLRSNYIQPFGHFAGELPHGGTLDSGHGVMERHEAHW